MSSLTKRELRAAGELRAILPQLHRNDIVFAILPDGAELLVKGRTLLDRVIATGRNEDRAVAHVPVLSAEAAAALEQVLGGDGSFGQPRTAVGHA